MATMIRSDNDIQTDVLDEFFWDPEVAAPDIGVEVDDGVVTLTGTVDRYVNEGGRREGGPAGRRRARRRQ
jgi:osmotically-inducible protein OsmY